MSELLELRGPSLDIYKVDGSYIERVRSTDSVWAGRLKVTRRIGRFRLAIERTRRIWIYYNDKTYYKDTKEGGVRT